MNEFDLIHAYFKPLAAGFPGSLNLTDDAALIDVPAGQQLVVTKDAIVEGVHFIGDENPELIAKKLLRTNLSDLAAKGAAPLCYFLAGILPKNISADWVKMFASGLAEDQKTFGIHLAGGDTTSTSGSLTLSLSALGLVPKGQMLKRSGAKIGDAIYVSGTLGDSALGLRLLSSPWKGEDRGGGQPSTVLTPSDPHPNLPPSRGKEFLIQRYLLPEPRLALGLALRDIATSCMDISDGLVQDLGHICKASGVGAIIHRHLLPLSTPVKDALVQDAGVWDLVLGGGDDYELLFSVAEEKIALLPAGVIKIGVITEGNTVSVLDESGNAIEIVKKGFSHF